MIFKKTSLILIVAFLSNHKSVCKVSYFSHIFNSFKRKIYYFKGPHIRTKTPPIIAEREGLTLQKPLFDQQNTTVFSLHNTPAQQREIDTLPILSSSDGESAPKNVFLKNNKISCNKNTNKLIFDLLKGYDYLPKIYQNAFLKNAEKNLKQAENAVFESQRLHHINNARRWLQKVSRLTKCINSKK